MPIELEAKFLNIDRADMRQRLQAAGFICAQPDTLMRRFVFDVPGRGPHAWARVRDEAGRITVSYKCTHDMTRVDGTEEIQITADSFDAAVALLEAVGLQRKSYQETRREVWTRGAIELTLDEWPALAPFCEIEAPTAAALQAVAEELGFEWAHALFGAVGAVYTLIGIAPAAINAAPRVTFDNVPDILALRCHGAAL